MSYFKIYKDDTDNPQEPFDVAVVIPSTLRPSLGKAILSIFRQDFGDRIQLLVGIDQPTIDTNFIDELCQGRPSNVTLCLFWPGYSTSVRHGGLHPCGDGGILRCVLTYLANSRHVAYLDDDNWWANDHLSSLKAAIIDKDWAYSLRWFVHPESLQPICIDQWESVGPEQGIFNRKFGGFSDPNTLMIDKLACESIINNWNRPLYINNHGYGLAADRNMFNALRLNFQGAKTGIASTYYVIDPDDGLHPTRLIFFGNRYAKAGQIDPLK